MAHARSAITLDAHGVLLLPDPIAMRDVLVAFEAQPDEETCWRAHYGMMRLLDQTPDPDWTAVSESMASALGVPRDRRDAAAPVVAQCYLSSQWVAAPGAADALAHLASDGYALAVIANSTHGHVERLLAEAGLCSTSGSCTRVAAVIDSRVVGIEKPDHRMFELALEALGTTPSLCIHVGDSIPLDVVPAKAAGIAAVHVDPDRLCTAPDHAHTASIAAFAQELHPDS